MQSRPVALITGAHKRIELRIAKDTALDAITLAFAGTRTVQQAAREPVRIALFDANGPTPQKARPS